MVVEADRHDLARDDRRKQRRVDGRLLGARGRARDQRADVGLERMQRAVAHHRGDRRHSVELDTCDLQASPLPRRPDWFDHLATSTLAEVPAERQGQTSCTRNYMLGCAQRPRGRHEAGGTAPHHDDHRRRPARTSRSTPTRWACAWSRRPSTSTSRTPTTSTSGTRPARPARSSPGSSSRARRRATRAIGDDPHAAARRRVRGVARLLGRAARGRGARRRRPALRRPRRARARARRSGVGNPPLRAVHPEIPAEHAITGLEGARAYGGFANVEERLLTDTLGFTWLGDGEYRLDGAERSFRWAYDAPVGERPARRGHRPPHRLGGARRGPPRLAGAGAPTPADS